MMVANVPIATTITGLPSWTSMSLDLPLVVLAFVIAVFGSLAGLQSARRARQRAGVLSVAWLATAALCIGGAAIWSMDLIGILAYRQDVAYSLSVSRTLLALVIAVAATGAGLYITSHGKGSARRYLAAGAITGLGIAAMHYVGRYSMQMDATLNFRLWTVGLSIIIAVATASLALFFAATVTRAWATAAASVVLAVGFCGVHAAGMAAATVTPHLDLTRSSAGGVDPFSLALRVFAIASVLLFGLMFVVLFDDDDGSAALARPQLG